MTKAELIAQIKNKESFLCVGLDPDLAKIPQHLLQTEDPLFEFCKAIIDATHPYAVAFKPNTAFFECHGAAGWESLRKTIAYIPNECLIIADAKRGDIGATATQYAKEVFGRYNAHAVTVSPYLGADSVEPYLEWEDRGVIVLCRTSNPGGSDLQFLMTDGVPLYLRVADLVANKWNKTGQCGLVVGATFPKELAAVRKAVGNDIPLLVPGIGAQGGDVAATCAAGCNTQRTGMMINSSRAILYAKGPGHWTEAAAAAAKQTRDDINAHR